MLIIKIGIRRKSKSIDNLKLKSKPKLQFRATDLVVKSQHNLFRL